MNYIKRFLIFSIIFIYICTTSVFAHGGKTDSKGGHNKKSDGTYHYHSGKDKKTEHKTKPKK